jgi:hypothetical protein
MPGTKTFSPTLEPAQAYHSHLVCWKAISAGLLISVMTYMVLSTLGFAIFGVAAQSAIENESGGKLLASGAGIWMALSAVVALFAGSYFAVRMSKFVTNKIGTAHGLVLASVFFIVMSVIVTSTIGSLSMGLGNLVSGLGKGAASIGSNSRVQDTINQAMGADTNFKSDPKIVSEGIAVRLLQGDTEGAKSYYAYQSGLSRAEVNSRIDNLQAEFTRVTKEVGDVAAEAAAATGISLFILFVAGVASAVFAGRMASQSNVKLPLEAQDVYSTNNHTPMFANQRESTVTTITGH